MTIQDLFYTILILLTFTTLRFGIPLLLMWVGKTVNSRLLHLQS